MNELPSMQWLGCLGAVIGSGLAWCNAGRKTSPIERGTMSLKRPLLLTALTVGLFAVSARPAGADTITLNITSDHCSEGCGGDGHLFGTVTLVQVGTNQVTMTVALNDGSKFVETGQGLTTIAFDLTGNQTISASNP